MFQDTCWSLSDNSSYDAWRDIYEESVPEDIVVVEEKKPVVRVARQVDLWSKRHRIWRDFIVSKPRCRATEAAWADKYPESIDEFLNPPDLEARPLLIRGPPGSGKSALARLLGGVDDVDKLTGRAQKNVIPTVVTATDRVVDKLEQACVHVELKPLPEDDRLRIVLGIAVKERVSFERRALQLIFARETHLGRAISTFQRIFELFGCVSMHNANKIYNLKRLVLAQDALPRERCDKCTLYPPCQHVSSDDLARRGLQRRAELPQRDAVPCACFVKTGACRTFNAFGRCSLHHPLEAHTLIQPTQRCMTCTLPMPCRCPYTPYRQDLVDLVDRLGRWIDKARNLGDIGDSVGVAAFAVAVADNHAFLDTSRATRPVDFSTRAADLRATFETITSRIPELLLAAEDRVRRRRSKYPSRSSLREKQDEDEARIRLLQSVLVLPPSSSSRASRRDTLIPQ